MNGFGFDELPMTYPVKDIAAPFDAYNGEDAYLFVSYSHRNKAQVYPIIKKLHQRKFRIWFDESCETGNDFREELRQRIANSSGVLLFISEDSMASKYCSMEIIVAQENKKPFFPIRLDDCELPSAFDLLLSNLHQTSADDMEKLLLVLERDLPPETMNRLLYVGDTLQKCEDYGSSIDVDEQAKHIGERAFYQKLSLRRIGLPDTLRTIGDESFRGCTNLTEMTIPLATEKIGESAFRDCVSMTRLTIHNHCIKIGERAFENCSELTEIELPEGLTEIYGGVFNSCRSLRHITLPKKLTVLGESAFSDCSHLETIDIPETVTKIDDLVFNGCTSLREVTLNEGLKKIGKGAFKNCRELVSITLPASVCQISDAVFRGCKNLTTIRVEPKNKFFKSEIAKNEGSLSHVLFNKNKSILYAYPAASGQVTYTVPDSVVTISDWAFSEAASLSLVIIPDSVREIGEGAFSNCRSLQKVEIPDSVTHIDDCAFRGCENLKLITIPDSVVEFGWGVFDGCSDNLVVRCYEGSAIEQYCISNRIQTERI